MVQLYGNFTQSKLMGIKDVVTDSPLPSFLNHHDQWFPANMPEQVLTH